MILYVNIRDHTLAVHKQNSNIIVILSFFECSVTGRKVKFSKKKRTICLVYILLLILISSMRIDKKVNNLKKS